MEKNQGITLVALVITIIILLILAGTSISLITGEDGLFAKANHAASLYNQKAKEEAELLNQLIAGNYIPTAPQQNLEPIPELTTTDLTISLDPDTNINPSLRGSGVIVTLTEKVQSGYQLQYSLNGDDNFTNYTAPFEVTDYGTVIIARLYDTATNREGDSTATYTVTNIDTESPNKFSYDVIETTETSIKISGTTTDATSNNSGSSTIKYQYKIGNGSWTTESESGIYTFKNLTAGTEYKIYMKAVDEAGNTRDANNSGNTVSTIINDYTENLVYKLALDNLANQPGVTITGTGVTVSSDKKYVTFDGNSKLQVSNDTIDPNGTVRTTSNSTICCWYRTTELVSGQYGGVNMILGYGERTENGVYNKHYIFIKSDGVMAGQGYATCNITSNHANKLDGEWHFVVGIWKNNNTVELYYDGVPFRGTGSYTQSNSYLNIGGSTDLNHYFKGDISDIRLYNEALTEEQVNIIYEYGKKYLKLNNVSSNDYTTDLVYKLNLDNLTNQPGVTITGTGVTVSSDNKYVTFDGNSKLQVSNDTIDPNGTIRTTSNSTICCWYRTTEIVSGQYGDCNLFLGYGERTENSVRNKHYLFVKSNVISAGQGYSTCDVTSNPSNKLDGEWHFVVGIWKNNNTVELYYDGVPFRGTGSYTQSNSYLNIGGSTDLNHYFKGDISDIRVYKKALTEDEIKQLYEYGKTYLGIN